MSPEIERLREALADRYHIDRALGEGGMATVYLADDLKHHRPVAIKVLKPEIASSLGRERFLREIATAARLTHPHIVPLHDSGEADGLLYYVMPFVEGESLRDRLKRDKQLPIDDAVEIACEVADALSFAHERGVVHRDIKPENVMFHGGHAAVADFGIARAVTAAAADLTAPGVAIGTPQYMSPEQAGGMSDVDARSDVYSLGCVLYEMLSGQPPFSGVTAESLMRQHQSVDPAPVSVVRSKVPRHVAAAIDQALAKTPADRHTSARAFAEALVTEIPQTAEQKRRRQLLKLSGVAALVVVALTIGGRVLGDRQPVPRVARSISVMPFAAPNGDPTLASLGRDLVVTLSANLDGVGGISTADALSVLAQTGDGLVPVERGIEVATSLNTSSFVHGSIIQVGTEVRIDYGLYKTADGGSLARGRVTGRPGNFAALSDSVTWGILRDIWQATDPPPVPNLTAITTRSIPALRAYLEGEQLLAQARFRDAPTAFLKAIEADSTFWFAYWRYNYAMAYHGQWVNPEIRQAIFDHLSEFPERDRLIIESRRAGSMTERIELSRQVTERFPQYWPAWFDYADQLVHNAPFLGYTLEDARAPLERVVALNPKFTAAWSHLMWIPLYNPDTIAGQRYRNELARLKYDSTSMAEVGLDGLEWYDALLELAASGGVPNRSTTERLSQRMVRYRGFIPPAGLVTEMSDYGFHRGQMELNEAVVARGVRREVVDAHLRRAATLWAARGAWDSALVAAERYADRTPDTDALLYGYRLATIGAWLGVVDTTAALEWQMRVSSVLGSLSGGDRGGVEWLGGLLAAARHDKTAVGKARDALANVDSETAPTLFRSLAAFALDLEGKTPAAGRALWELERERTEQWHVRMLQRTEYTPYLTGINRLAAARWLLASGDTTDAARLLTWHEAVLPGASDTRLADAALAGIAFLERARIERARGRRELAREYYEQFLRRYDAPSKSVTHLVREAEAYVRGVDTQ